MRVCRNSHKLKITLATESCNEGDFDKREVLIHPHLFSLFSSFINLLVLYHYHNNTLQLLFDIYVRE